MSNTATVEFILNGEDVCVPDADLLAPLATTIRERLHATGTKIACGQGNCGACAIIVRFPPSSLSSSGDSKDDDSAPPPPQVVNSCLFPTAKLLDPNGKVSVMTVEGAHDQDIVGKEIAECNGTQCGFCTPGMVVKATSHALDTNHSCSIPDIEDLLDGNICRCTGYRPILFALKKRFGESIDGVPVDERFAQEIEETPPCVVRGPGGSYGDYKASYSSGRLSNKNVYFPAGDCSTKVPSTTATAATTTSKADREMSMVRREAAVPGTGTMVPGRACKSSASSLTKAPVAGDQGMWYSPSSLDQLLGLLKDHPGARLVAGNIDSYRTPLSALPANTVFVSVSNVEELSGPIVMNDDDHNMITIPANTTLFQFFKFLQGLDEKQYDSQSIASHVKSIANIQVRNIGTVAGNLIAAHKDKLPSDVSLILSAMEGSVFLKAPGIDQELELAAGDFCKMKGALPNQFKQQGNNWVCTKLTVKLPVTNQDSVRCARLSPRTNFPTVCSVACSSYKGGNKVVRVAGAGNQLLVLELAGDNSSPTASLKTLSAQLGSSSGLSAENERIVLHMSARVLGIDGENGQMAVSQTAQRRDQGQRGEQRFFVDPAQAPVTEPLVKDAAYEHVKGAVYPIDVPPPVGSLNGTPIMSPAAVTEFDPWLLKDAAMNLLKSFDSKVLVLTAADMPYEPGDIVVDNIYSKQDTPTKIYSRMFTYRNVIVDDSKYGAKLGVVPAVPDGALGPGGFGEFVLAPGFTTFAGQVIALVLHPDETTSRRLAAKLQKILEDFFKPGEATWGVNKLEPDPKIKNLTPTHAIRNVSESKQNKKLLGGGHFSAVHAHGTKSMYDEQADPQEAKARYEDMWSKLKEDPNITYVETTEPIVAGRQTHLYMETQNATVHREEDRFFVISSTQSPKSVQDQLAPVLGVCPRDVVVSFQRIGGGFGGKAYQSLVPASLAAFSCLVTRRPTRVAMDRQHDFEIHGKRHQLQGNYRVAVNKKTKKVIAMELTYDGDAGCSSASTQYVLQRAIITSTSMYRIPEFRCNGNSWLTHKQTGTAFRSFGVIQAMTVTETAMDHAHAQLQSDLGILVDAPSWRRSNFYAKVDKLPDDADPEQWTDSSKYPVPPYFPRIPRNLTAGRFTHYGQELFETDHMCHPSRGAWAQATTHNPFFREAEKDCALFNEKNKFRKRAVAVTPLLYGAGYESWPQMQGAASVAISWAPSMWAPPGQRPGAPPTPMKEEWQYARLGYVLVNQGGCEMGQGVHVAVVQGVAAALNVPLGLVRVGKVNTDGTPNIVSTEGSTGSDINVPAAVKTAKVLRHTLEKMLDGFIYVEAIKRDLPVKEIWDRNKEMFIASKCHPRNPHDEWYRLQRSFEQKPYPAGPRSETDHINHYIKYFRSWHIPVDERSMSLPSFYIWEQVVNLAFENRVPLFAGTMDGPEADGGRPSDVNNVFAYQTYACAWSQVEVDGMTGEIDVLRTDIFYDAGLARNPAVDIGQIEGAFVQGLGNLTTEECEYDFDTGLTCTGLIKSGGKPKEYETGRLLQASIMKYAVPEHRTIPRVLVTHLSWIYGPDAEPGNKDGDTSTPKSSLLNKFEQAQPPPGDLTDYRRAKATGEPPLVLAVTVLSATREAVRLLKQSLLNESVTFVPMSTPLTPRHVLNVIWGEKNVLHAAV